jgi:hypothetical protein
MHSEIWGGGDLKEGLEGRRPVWRPRRRWEDNVKTDLQEVCREA